MPNEDDISHEETIDPLVAGARNFYKVDKWTRDGAKVDSLLYAGNSLGRARSVFARAIKHRPRIHVTIRQQTRVLEPVPAATKRTHIVAMEITSGLIIAFIVLAAPVHPAMQPTQFDCTITKIAIKNVPEPGTSEPQKEQITFWIDDIEKSLVFADGARLHITRFDQS